MLRLSSWTHHIIFILGSKAEKLMPDIFRGQSVDKNEIQIYTYRYFTTSYQIHRIPASVILWKLLNMRTTIEMETDQILLRRWVETDAEALFKYASDPDVGPRAGWEAHKSVKESLEVIRTFFNNDSIWAIVLKETGEPIGCIGYYAFGASNIGIGKNDCEVGYWVGKPYWNRGVCTQALRLMLDYCVSVKRFENIWADHFIGNPASGRVMEKCGFVDTGMLNKCSGLLGGDKELVRIYKYENV